MTNPLGGVTAAMAMANLAVAFGGCPHPNAVPVELLDGGAVVAWLCPDCDTQLPAEWRDIARKAERRQQQTAAYDLMTAGYSPSAALEAVGLVDKPHDHAAADCPKRVDITRLADPTARYMHGACEPEAHDA